MQATVGDPAVAPSAPNPPTTRTTTGSNLPRPGDGRPSAEYAALVAQGKVLRQQLEGLLDQRTEEIAKLDGLSGKDFEGARADVQARMARLDKRIAGIEEQIAQVDAQTVSMAGIPGAVEDLRARQNSSDDEENFFGGAATATTAILLFVFIRRKFFTRKRKGSNAAIELPGEIASRLERLEGVAEATQIEVERIGEGQRFVTKLLSETRQGQPVK